MVEKSNSGEKIAFTHPSRVGDGVPFIRNGHGTPGQVVKFLQGNDPRGTSWTAQVLGGESRYGGKESLERPYEEAGWAHVAIKAIASAVRQCRLVFYKEDPKKNPDAEPIPDDHPLTKLFNRPNRIMDPARFLEAGAIHRKLDGEDFWFLFTDTNHPVETDIDEDGIPRYDYPAWIMPVRGSRVQMSKDKFGFPAVWKYPTNKADGLHFQWGSVIQFADYDPDNPLRGLGDLQAILRDLALEFGAQRYLEAMLANSGDPGGVITSEDAMSEEEEDRASQEVQQKFALANAFKWHVISGEGIKYTPNKFGPKDMQFHELLKWIRDKTGALFGVPLPVMGILDDANFSNYSEAVKQFWQHGNGILAYMATVETTINHEFLPRLKDETARTFVCRFDTSHVEALQDDKVAKVELALKLVQGKIGLSWEEAASISGLSMTDSVVKFGSNAFMDPNTTTAEMIIKFAEEKAKNDAAANEPPAVGSSGEEDDFPGSDGFDSGSNGPTGSDGKTASHAETNGGTATTVVSVQRGALPTDEAGLLRREYFKSFDDIILRPGEAKVRAAANRFLKKYAAAQFKLVEDFARNGPAGLSKNVYSPADIVANDALMGGLLLAYAEWVKKLADEMGVPLAEVLEAAADDFAPEIGGVPIPADDPWASNFLRTNNIRLAEGVNSTLAAEVRAALVSAFEGQPFSMASLQDHVRRALPELRDALARAFSGRSARASTIARTEVNRAANGTRYEQMRREGVEEHQWATSGDAHVRSRDPHSHVALDGVIRKVGDSFREGAPLHHPGDPAGDPEDVINCFPAGTLVAGEFIAASRFLYKGPGVELATKNGHKLTVTPNHPVLTPQGFVAASLLQEGDHVLAHSLDAWNLPWLDPDNENGPVSVEDAFQAIDLCGGGSVDRSRVNHFHGDARFAVGEVNVVSLYGELADEFVSEALASRLEGLLEPADTETPLVSCFGSLQKRLACVAGSAPCSPSLGELPSDGGGVATLPLQGLRFGTSTYMHSAPSKEVVDGDAVDPELPSKLIRAGSGDVVVDKIVRVRRVPLFGHVYDVQSTKGWLIAQGIANSNCRCVTRPLVKD